MQIRLLSAVLKPRSGKKTASEMAGGEARSRERMLVFVIDHNTRHQRLLSCAVSARSHRAAFAVPRRWASGKRFALRLA